MYIWFFLGAAGMIASLPPFFRSVEHQKLARKYGPDKGRRIGDLYGRISGWGFFTFWAVLWLAPQPRFILPGVGAWLLSILGWRMP